MKSNKLFLMLLSLVLSLTVLVACTQDEKPADDGKSTSAETDASTGTSTSAETDASTDTSTSAETDASTDTSDGETAADSGTDDTAEDTASDTADATDTSTGDADETDSTTGEADTDEDTTPEETETQMPRYDYFEADVSKDVKLDKSVYTSMNLTLPASLQITDEQVQSYIDYLVFQERKAVNGDTKVYDQPLKLGDTAYIYYRGTINGEEFEGGSNMEDEASYGLGLGSGAFIPGFEEGLVGVIPNQTSKENPAEVHVTFPENYNEELSGKDAIFYVYVEYAVQYTLPEYNRAFVEDTLGYESEKIHVTEKSFLNEFAEFIKAFLEEQNAENVEYAKTDALWTYLTETAECSNLPQPELDYYIASYKDELTSAYEYYASYYGEEFINEYPEINDFAIAYMGFEKGSDWEEEITALATQLVKKDMIMHAIAEAEGIETVTEEDLEKEIQYWIDYYSNDYYEITREDILKNIGEDYLRESAFYTKIYDYLMANCTFTYEA